MSLYPSLEDMKVDQMMKAQVSHLAQNSAPPIAYPTSQPVYPSAPAGYPSTSYPTASSSGYPSAPPPSYPSNPPSYPINPTSIPVVGNKYESLYPDLDYYMGMSLKEEHGATASTQLVPASQNAVGIPVKMTTILAPISGKTPSLARAQLNHGLREVILCKDGKGRVGLRVQPINKGVFIILVQANTPASLAGLRFGDQILMINDVAVAGMSMDEVHKMIKKADPNRITMVVRDRPFERTVTVHKDSVGSVGFFFKNGKIASIVKDSSAARNGMLIDHNILEVNGQNVVGLKDKAISAIIKESSSPVTITVMPSFVYDHMMKHTAQSFISKTMDHSIPDL